MNMNKTSITLALAATLGASGIALADGNPFAMQELKQGYMVAEAGEGKCGEGKCGGAKADAKSAEGKCGEGKCGADKSNAKATEGKCGEGKCGGSK
jgi:uncharacterized low-complexity protein